MTQGGSIAGDELATLLVHTHSPHHYSRPRLGAAVDHARTPVVGNTGHFRTRLSECARRNLEGRLRTRGRASAKAAGSLPAVRTHPSVRWGSRRCNGPQRIRSEDRRFRHEGWERPLTPGGSGFPYHHRIGHRIQLAPKGCTEGNRVLDDGSVVDCTQA